MHARRHAFEFVRVAALVWVGALLGLPSCREPTQITLELSTDVACPEVHDTSIGVGSLGSVKGKPPVATQSGCKSSSGRIGSLVVVPNAEKDDEVAIQVVTGVNGQSAAACDPANPSKDCIVARRALRFVPHTPLLLPIEMSASCLGKLCPDDQTCLDGQCVAAKLPDPEGCTTPGGCGPKLDAGAGDALSEAGSDALLEASADAPLESGTDAPLVDSSIDAKLDADTDSAVGGDLVAYFTFDQTTGASLLPDESGTGNDGTLISATLDPTGGHKAGGLVLKENGASTLRLGPTPSLGAISEATGATVAAWVNCTVAPTYSGMIFDHEPYTTDTLEAWINSSLAVCVDAGPTPQPGPHYAVCSPIPLKLGIWAHVAIVADANAATVYLDGAGVATVWSPAPSFVLNGNSYFGYGWSGVIDDVRIYKRALSASEVAALAKL